MTKPSKPKKAGRGIVRDERPTTTAKTTSKTAKRGAPPIHEEGSAIVSSRRSKKLISDAAAAVAAAEAKLRARVGEARANGVTWEEIGEALGTTRQSAHARFSKDEEAGA